MKHKLIFSLFVVLPIFIQQNSFAQNFENANISFHHISVENGLSQSNVFCMIQDRKGYLWIGTQYGLNRFDGFSFTHFIRDPLDKAGLSSSIIQSIFETDSNEFFIGTEGGGLNIYNPLTNHFTSFTHSAENEKSISNDIVRDICHYKDNLFWISTWGGGLDLFDASSKTFKHFHHNERDSNSLSFDFITKMIKDKNRKIYLSTREGLNVLDELTLKFKIFKSKPQCLNCISNDNIQTMFDDGDKLWLGTRDGVLNSFDKRTELFSHFETGSDIPINSIVRISDSILWLGTEGRGILIFNENEKGFQSIINNPYNPSSLSNNSISIFFISSDSMLWIGTNGSGLNYYHKSFNHFNNTDQQFINNTLDYTQNNYSIYKDASGIIWSGSFDKGLRAYNSNNGSVKIFQSIPTDKNSLSKSSVISLFKDDENNLWVGTLDGGVNRLDKNSGKFFHYLPDTSSGISINQRTIFCINQTNDKRLWFGTMGGGIYIFDNRAKKFSYLKKDITPTPINNNYIYCIKEDHKGNIVIGMQGGGFNIINAQDGRVDYFLNDRNNKNSISSNHVQAVYEDEKGLLWLGTVDGGLNVFDRKKNIFHCFTEKEGLPNNTVYCVLPDETGSLWMSTNKGICKFSYTSNLDVRKLNDASYISKNISIKNYDHSDGLTSDEFNQGAYFKATDGTMYFGGVKGIISFKPSEITSNTFAPPAVITKIRNYKEEIPFNDSTEIELDYKNYLTVEFASLSYLIPEKNKYAFMFEGRDTSWNDLGTTRTVSFLDLKPGDYVLKIRSSNNDGVWGLKPAELKIKVNPPFYETWWFRILVIVVVVVAVVITFRTRVSRIRKEEKQKTAFNKSLAEMEMKALRAQMNPHFVFNCLNSIHNYILKNDKLNASDYLTKFSRLIRMILENSRHKTVPLKKDMEALELYIKMEQLRLSEPCTVNINIEDDFEIADALIPPLILQPFVENSFKHGLPMKGKDGVLTINIKAENDSLICIVEDNGVGRKTKTDEEKPDRKSLGMTITKERLNVISQSEQSDASYEIIDLKNDLNQPCGTKVVVKIPLVYS